VGLAVGVTPLYGLHLWIVLAICVPLRLDAALAYLAANVSLPFLSPFLLLAEVELGSLARTGHTLAIDVADVKARAPRELVAELVVGTAIFAPLVAAVGGAITWVIAGLPRTEVRGRVDTVGSRDKPASGGLPTALDAAVARVAARYAHGGRAAYHYVRGKLASDPVAGAVAELGGDAGLGDVVDVGCGRGQLAALLLEMKRATRVHGVDWDAAKVDDARAACAGLDAEFAVGDARNAVIPPCDTALAIDVLHYLTDAEQDALLARMADAAGARVVVRELDPDRGWRSAVTRLQERVTTGIGFNRGARVNARPIHALTTTLEARGFSVRVEPCWGGTPFANVIVVAERR
jgi:SAM-dependent methyltransferase